MFAFQELNIFKWKVLWNYASGVKLGPDFPRLIPMQTFPISPAVWSQVRGLWSITWDQCLNLFLGSSLNFWFPYLSLGFSFVCHPAGSTVVQSLAWPSPQMAISCTVPAHMGSWLFTVAPSRKVTSSEFWVRVLPLNGHPASRGWEGSKFRSTWETVDNRSLSIAIL